MTVGAHSQLLNHGRLYNGYVSSGTSPLHGTLNSYGDLLNSGTIDNGLHDTLTLEAGSSYNFVRGTLNNSGTLDPKRDFTLGASNAGTVNLNGGNTLNNGATLTNAMGHLQGNRGALNNMGTLDNQVGAVLENYASATLANGGTLSNESGATLVNQSGGALDNQSAGTVTNAGSISNLGTITNAGRFTVTSTGAVTGPGSFTQDAMMMPTGTSGTAGMPSGPTTTINGFLAQTSMAIDAGRLQGTGTLNVTNPITIGANAIIDPGAMPGMVGTLTSDGTIDISGTLNIDLASMISFDHLNVTGATSQVVFEQGSAIHFMLDGSFMPMAGATFDFLSAAGGVSGLGNVTYGFTGMGMGLPSGLTDTVVAINGGTGLQLDITQTPAAVPLPAAGWLFLSGLIGLVGIARRASKAGP